uniref:Uncharacterized protein n=1 Tax=Anguilla anguilla TaxID=7936 RepID=A0A0E9SM07_ANGAN
MIFIQPLLALRDSVTKGLI